MPLTPHQSKVQEEGLQKVKKHMRLLIKGSAGVGKTYLMKSFIEEMKKFLSPYKTIYCAAPTNKAVAVLKGKVGDMEDVEFITLHSALKYRRMVDNKTGEVSFGPMFDERNKPLKGVSAIIVDETSMVGKQIHRDLEYFATLMNVVVVFIGDHKQLNPVGEEISTVFLGRPKLQFGDQELALEEGQTQMKEDDGTYVYTPYPEVELTEIIRQGNGNPIIELSRNIDGIWEYRDNLVSLSPKMGYMHSKDREKVVETLAAVNGSDDLKYLGYTNQEVDSLNQRVRKRIYGNPRKVEPGESLVFNSPYKDLYFTNQEIKVDTVDLSEEKFFIYYNDGTYDEIKLKVYVLNGYRIEGGYTGIFVIHEKDDKELRKLAVTTKRACLKKNLSWRERDNFLSQFADIKYNHALTVHKSQGSTYKQVILNVSNLSLNRDEIERKRLFYTGITRASELLILFNN